VSVEHQIADMHCHYPMHLLADESGGDPYLEPLRKIKKRTLWHKIRAILVRLAAKRLNFERGEEWLVNLETLDRGGIRLVFSVLYVPETELGVEEWVSGEPADHSFGELLTHMTEVEEHLAAPRRGGPGHALVTRASQLDAAGTDQTIRFVHCIEGGAHLGSNPAEIEARVRTLSEKGVGYITLAHLFWRHVATNAPALPGLSDGVYDFVFPQPDDVGLTELGVAAVEAMYRYGVLIDISHMRQTAIDHTFELLADLDQRTGNDPTAYPVLATHAGWRFSKKHSYMLSPEAVDAVARRKGVVGLIMAHHLLNDDEGNPGNLEKTMRSVHAHVDALRDRTRSYENIGLGTDLDGFIKPTVGGIESAADMATLAARIHEAYPEGAYAILHGNALRALKAAYARRAETGIGLG
jgi:microsomal dipeptidase-like Zn-dependent dipeptidase